MRRRHRRSWASSQSSRESAACIPGFCLCTPFRLPSTLVDAYHRYESPQVGKKVATQSEIDSIPQVLGPRLTRSLTIGREEADRSKEDSISPTAVANASRDNPWTIQKTCTAIQEQSPLFKLPLEIRQQIYEYVLGGCHIQIHFQSARPGVISRIIMGHRQVQEDALSLNGDRFPSNRTSRPPSPTLPPTSTPVCLCSVLQDRMSVDLEEKRLLLALPTCCRRVYSETIEFLYRSNKFYFRALEDVLKLSLTILPERMCLIQKVTILNNDGSEGWSTFSRVLPWLDCRASSGLPCSCISCMPKDLLPNRQAFNWILYTWIMRILEGSKQSRKSE
ncbi:hypothetical protein ONS96_001066 [Cadophora gregata f. sp. sojae]|nr:hypothetical protein ONS96_001066 [Cadophora gregata f. sp. sojae]